MPHTQFPAAPVDMSCTQIEARIQPFISPWARLGVSRMTWYRWGKPGDTRQSDRFASKYIPEPNSGCWIWIGALSSLGYGQYHDGGRTREAHSVSYERKHGPVSDGYELGHIRNCVGASCVNPDHVRPITHAANVRERKCCDVVIAQRWPW
jgi:hypothetical protein